MGKLFIFAAMLSLLFSSAFAAVPTDASAQNAALRLAPSRELVFSKQLNYQGGFSKLFFVYKTTDGQAESFSSEIVLFFNYTGSSTMSDFDILDSVPTSVLSRASQISFAKKPAYVAAEPKFEWHVGSIRKGGSVSYSYSFDRPLTEQMISMFGAPKIRTAKEAALQSGADDESGLLAASIGPIFGVKLPLAGVLLAFVVLLAFLYLFLFGKKKEED
jgi:hypothetical protein